MKITVTTLMLFGSFFSANAVCSHTIERSEVSYVRTRVEQEGDKDRKLHVRISMLESKKFIGNPRSRQSGKTIQLFLPLNWFDLFSKNKMAGSADFFVNLPRDIEKVTIGKQNVEIWPEDRGAKRLDADEVKARDIALRRFQLDCPKVDSFDTIVAIKRHHSDHKETLAQCNGPEFDIKIYFQNSFIVYEVVNSEIVRAYRQSLNGVPEKL
jgi:hypothetical protein